MLPFLKLTWLAKVLPWGLVGKVLLVGLVVLAVPAAMLGAYRIGASKATAECTTATQEAVIEALGRQAALDRKIREEDYEILFNAVETEIRTVTEIREIVRDPVATPDCPRLGDEWMRKYNALVRAVGGAHRAATPGPRTPADDGSAER